MKAIILHPYEVVAANGVDRFSQEATALADYLFGLGCFDNILTYSGQQIDLNQFDCLFLSSFKYERDNHITTQLYNLDEEVSVIYWVRDTEEAFIPQQVLPKEKFKDRLGVRFCGRNWLEALQLLGLTPKDHWVGRFVGRLQLWQNEFKGKRRHYDPKGFWDEFDYDSCYIGGSESDENTDSQLLWLVCQQRRHLFIKWDSKIGLDNCEYLPRLTAREAAEKAKTSLSQLVVGGKYYSSMMPASRRVLKGLSESPFIFVHRHCDPECYLFSQYPLLKKYFWVLYSNQIVNTLYELKDNDDILTEVLTQFDKLYRFLTNSVIS